MEPANTATGVFDLGTYLGRKQAFGLIAGRCAAAELETLAEVYENKLYLAIEPTWEDYCRKHLGVGRRTAERAIQRYHQLGPNYTRLNCFARISPSEYRLIEEAVTDEGLSYHGEIIPLEPENAALLAETIEALRIENAPQPTPADDAAAAFARAERSLRTAIAEFRRLQSMSLPEDDRLRLVVDVESGRDELQNIRQTTDW